MALEYEEIDLGQVDGIDGINGREIELQITATHIQWRYKGASTWTNLVALSTITGPQGIAGIDGKKLMLQKTATHLQYKYENETTWTNLLALTDITGPTGETGTSIRIKGAWTTGMAYVNNAFFTDCVTYGGETYGCVKSHTSTASILPTNTTYWIKLAEKVVGPIGPQGLPGKDGNAKIANDLTTTDATYALSAPQGKVLKGITDDILDGTKTVSKASTAASVPWSGVSGKPTTFAPILGETASTAYDGTKGKATTDAVNKILGGTVAVKKASILLGNNGGKNSIMGRWEGYETGIVWDVDASSNLPVANSMKIMGAQVYAHVAVVNPAGNDVVGIPFPPGFKGSIVYLHVANSNANASRAFVRCAVSNADHIVAVLDQPYNNNIQFSVLIVSI